MSDVSINPQGFDEMFASSSQVRSHYSSYHQWLLDQSKSHLKNKHNEAEYIFRKVGITFNVYGEAEETERLIPFDIVPRIIPSDEWDVLEAGTIQRVKALNAFLYDIYHEQEILKAGFLPKEQVLANKFYEPFMVGMNLPNDIYSHISGVDLIRDDQGNWLVLEDNLRTPSGVSYMIENRRMMMRLFPELFSQQSVAPIEHYPEKLLETLQQSTFEHYPTVVVLTPGRFNSAYFEHAFLARQMGVELVEGKDLFIKNATLYMRTTSGPKKVDVIYRRIDDDFLDPLTFNPDSILGVPGLLSVYREGNVILANAVGTGIADDKSIYPYVPDMINFYLDEEPILHNVPTWQCREPEQLAYVLDNLQDLVVKEVHGAGGYGMLIGPAASQKERDEFAVYLRADPNNYIAQPTISLSTCPIFVHEGISPRHIDLRPFVLTGRETVVLPGGLTRVAMKEGSLVVNSSQGGGTKDTWILDKIYGEA